MSRLGRLFDRFRAAPAVPQRNESAEPAAARWIIAGLGNPGGEYQRSRHNTGFMAVEKIAGRHGVEMNRRKFNGIYGEATIAGAPAIVVKPQTFYNRSGECITALSGYFKVPPERLIVIHDEMDLPFPRIRMKMGGGDAGNRGIRSVTEALGTPDFIRIRIGVGHPNEATGAIEHVLKAFSAAELHELEPILERVCEAAASIIQFGLERSMAAYNQRA